MKERKGLHPAIAFVLMLLMLCGALLNGAQKHWSREKEIVIQQTQTLEAAMSVCAETAQNLLTVARRHLAQDEALCVSLDSSRAVVQNAALPLSERMAGCKQLTADAQNLLQMLAQTPSVLADDRDQMYVALMLPQAVEQCEDMSAFTAYDQAAEAYNKGLGGSFSGVLAQLIGYEIAPQLEGMQPAVQLNTTEIAYPMQRGYINDDAAVLSSETIDDINELNNRLESVEFTIVTRHFLGGADAQEYSKGLFAHWQLDEDDVLLLLVIGEERYAVCMGEKIRGYVSNEQLMSLSGTQLRAPFVNERDYDRAAGDFLLALSRHIVRISGEEADFGGLFGTEEIIQEKIFDNWSGPWWQGFFAEDDYEEDLSSYDDTVYEAHEIDLGSLLVLAVVLYVIARGRRRTGKGGLGLIGWLIAFSIVGRIGDILGILL